MLECNDETPSVWLSFKPQSTFKVYCQLLKVYKTYCGNFRWTLTIFHNDFRAFLAGESSYLPGDDDFDYEYQPRGHRQRMIISSTRSHV